MSGRADTGSGASHGDPRPEANRVGSTSRREDHSNEDPSYGNGGRMFAVPREGQEAGQEKPRKHIPETRDPGCCR